MINFKESDKKKKGREGGVFCFIANIIVKATKMMLLHHYVINIMFVTPKGIEINISLILKSCRSIWQQLILKYVFKTY